MIPFTYVLIRFAIPITGPLDDALVLQEEIEVKTFLEVVGLVLLYVCPSQYAANLWKMSHTRNSLLPLGVQFIFWRLLSHIAHSIILLLLCFIESSESSQKVLEAETNAIVKWSKKYPFVLAASLYGGSLVASYPFDAHPKGRSLPHPTNDDDVFRYLASTYANSHPSMHYGKPLCPGPSVGEEFPKGITNGAAWKSKEGGMKDYMYQNSNCFEIGIHMGCCKFPYAQELEHHWKEHKDPLFFFVFQVRNITLRKLNFAFRTVYFMQMGEHENFSS